MLVLAVGTDGQFRKLCKILEKPHLIEDERFANNHQRVIHRTILKEILKPLFEKFLAKELLTTCHHEGVPIGQVRDMEEVFEIPLAQEMILPEILSDGKETKRVKTVAFQIES